MIEKAGSRGAGRRHLPLQILALLLAAAALAPLLYLITSLVANYYYAPYYDSWSFYYRIARFMNGDAGWVWDLFSQQNESRPLIPRLILLLAHSFSHNLAIEVVLNVASAVATAGVTLLILKKTNQGLSWVALLAAAVFFDLNFFSLAQWQNWNWRNQIIMLLPNVFFAVGWLINLSSVRPLLRGALVSLCCALATFSFANGMFQWFLIIPIAIGLSRKEKIRMWSLHGGAAVVCLTIYFVGYHTPRGSDTSFAFSHPEQVFAYFFAWLGSSLSADSLPLAIVWGAVLLLTFCALGFECYRRWRSGVMKVEWLPWLAFGCYALISASLTALARSHIGLEQALRPRYCTISQWLIVGIIGLSVTLFRESRTRKPAAVGLFGLLAAAFLLFTGRQAMQSAIEWDKFSEWMHFQEQSFGLEREEPGQLWSFNHPDRHLVLVAYGLMRQAGFLHDSFHSSKVLGLLATHQWGARNDGEMEVASSFPFREIRCRGWSVGGGPEAGNRVLVVLIEPNGKVLAVADGPIDKKRPDVSRYRKPSSPALAGFDLTVGLPRLKSRECRVAAFRYGPDKRVYHSIGAPQPLHIGQ